MDDHHVAALFKEADYHVDHVRQGLPDHPLRRPMALSSPALIRLQSVCVTCVRGGQRVVLHYRDFLLDPGTLFTLASLLLLIAASIQAPDGLVNSAHAHLAFTKLLPSQQLLVERANIEQDLARNPLCVI